MKNISEMEWNSFVCFTVDKENCKGPAKQPQKSSIYMCKLILKLAILLKITHFQLYIQNKQLRLLVVLGLPHILTVINFMFLRNVSTKKLILCFHCYFVLCSSKFKHFGKS